MLLFLQNAPDWEPYRIVRIVNADGSGLRTLEQGVEAAWSADGRFIHIVSQDTDCVPSLITEAPDGSGRVVVNRGLRTLDFDFAWSPDESQVMFLRYRGGPPPRMCGSQGGAYQGLVFDLWVMNADGTEGRVLAPDFPLNGLPGVVWSPDSSRIAFVDPAEYPVPSGAISTSVAFVRVRDGRRTASAASILSGGPSGLAWSPDGTRLAVSYRPDPVVSLVHIGVIDAMGSSRAFIDLTTSEIPGLRLEAPAWSPDGTTIAVTRQVDGPGGTVSGGDILLVDPVKGGILRDLGLTDADGPGTPAWSADGGWLAYVSEAPASNGIPGHLGPIVEVAIDGSARREVAGTTMSPGAGFVEWVAWQPPP